MKLLIAGPRAYEDWEEANAYITMICKNIKVTEVVSGACSIGKNKYSKPTFVRPDGTKVYGADGLGERWAAENNIPVKPFPADWNGLGKVAGPMRNTTMAQYLDPEKDRAIVFYQPYSAGSTDMIKKLKKKGVILREKLVKT